MPFPKRIDSPLSAPESILFGVTGRVYAKVQRRREGRKEIALTRGTSFHSERDRIAGKGRIAAPLLGGAGGGFTQRLRVMWDHHEGYSRKEDYYNAVVHL